MRALAVADNGDNKQIRTVDLLRAEGIACRELDGREVRMGTSVGVALQDVADRFAFQIADDELPVEIEAT